MRKAIFLLFYFNLFVFSSYAQEFSCRFKVNDVQVQIADKSIYQMDK
jgi:hypothetical protein